MKAIVSFYAASTIIKSDLSCINIGEEQQGLFSNLFNILKDLFVDWAEQLVNVYELIPFWQSSIPIGLVLSVVVVDYLSIKYPRERRNVEDKQEENNQKPLTGLNNEGMSPPKVENENNHVITEKEIVNAADKQITNPQRTKTPVREKQKPKSPVVISQPAPTEEKEQLEQIEETNQPTNEILRVDYSSSRNAQTDVYPVYRFPKENTVVRSYRSGKTKQRGFKEEDFQDSIEQFFGEDFLVLGEIRINTGPRTRPFEPDIALINKKNASLRIDIEIDEPYAGISRQPTHCMREDTMRDNFFVDRGWIVIRFSEYQVHLFEEECLRYISEIIEAVSPSYTIPEELSSNAVLNNERFWDTVQAQKWEKEKYREKYLNHEFGDGECRTENVERDLNEQESTEEGFVQPTIIGHVDNGPLIRYNAINKHPNDKRIEYYPEHHVYTIDKIPAPSVSTIISKFFPGFDMEYWASRKAPELGMSPNEVAQMWREEGEKAAQAGTHLHKQIENYYLGKEYTQPEEFSFFEQFVVDHPEKRPYRTEWRIFDENNHLAGTIDLLTKSSGGYEIYDWKRSKKVLNPCTGKPICHNRWQRGVGPLREIDHTSYNRYCLQQNLYRYILEKNYGLTISRMFLIVLHPDYNRYYKIEVPYQQNTVECILETL